MQHRCAVRKLLLGLGLFFAGLPLAFAFNDPGVQWLMWRDQPLLAGLSLATSSAAFVLWWGSRSPQR